VDQIAINSVNRRERKKCETRQQIIDSAMEMFRKKGFQATSMEQIANRVDISKVTIYNYFPVKEAIVSEFMQATTSKRKEEEILRLIESFPDTKSRLMDFYRRSFEEMKGNREIYKVYFGYRMKSLFESIRDPSTRSGFEGLLAMILSAGQEAGEIRQDMSAELLARHLEMMGAVVFMPWWIDPDTFTLEENLRPAIDLFLNGTQR
jgi:AcrR family transcriptional regulator